MKRSFVLCLLVVSAIAWTGCTYNEALVGGCDEGSIEYNEEKKVYYKCEDNRWMQCLLNEDGSCSTQKCDCPNGCNEDGTCKEPTTCDCPNGCNEDGSCKPADCPETCPNGCNPDGSCKPAECPKTCTNGCNPDGSCKPADCPETCTNGCNEDGSCKPADCSETCTNGCNEDGSCKPTDCPETCTNGCNNDGSCKPTDCPETCTNGCNNDGSCKPVDCPETCPNGCNNDGSCKPADCPTTCPHGCNPDGLCKPAECPETCTNGCHEDGSCKCTEDEQCGEGFVCRKDGDERCASEFFTTVWDKELRTQLYNNKIDMIIPFKKPNNNKLCTIEICWDWNEDEGVCKNGNEDGSDSDAFEKIDLCKISSPIVKKYKSSDPNPGEDLIIKIRGNLNGYHIPDKDIELKKDKKYAPYLLEVRSFGQVGLAASAFKECYNLKSVSLVDIPDATKLTNMDYMFKYCCSLESPLENWDVSNVTSMKETFKMQIPTGEKNYDYCRDALSDLEPSRWDVSKVTTMHELFRYSSFDQPINDWDVSQVTDMYGMFAATPYNQPLNKWKTLKVTDMQHMFNANFVFNQDISSWNVSKVTRMDGMFERAESFNNNIGGWTVSNVTNMNEMFMSAKSFNQDISGWNVSKVTSMIQMFHGAEDFDKDISKWKANISKRDDINGMFSTSGVFEKYLSSSNKESTNLCKIYKFTTWETLRDEIKMEVKTAKDNGHDPRLDGIDTDYPCGK